MKQYPVPHRFPPVPRTYGVMSGSPRFPGSRSIEPGTGESLYATPKEQHLQAPTGSRTQRQEP